MLVSSASTLLLACAPATSAHAWHADTIRTLPSNRVAASHPVETVFLSGIEAFNSQRLDSFLDQFASDIEMYTHSGWLRGKDTVHNRFASLFAQFPSLRMEIHDLKVREVAPGAAVVDFRWSTYPTGSGPAYHGVGSGVYVLRNGRWVEVMEHETLQRVDEALLSQEE